MPAAIPARAMYTVIIFIACVSVCVYVHIPVVVVVCVFGRAMDTSLDGRGRSGREYLNLTPTYITLHMHVQVYDKIDEPELPLLHTANST